MLVTVEVRDAAIASLKSVTGKENVEEAVKEAIYFALDRY